MTRFCILTPTPDYPEDWSVPRADYERLLGPDLQFRCWVDAGDLTSFDKVLPLLAWGYPRDVVTWRALLDDLEAAQIPVINPVSVLRWNTDKGYLAELAAGGVPTVPTLMRDALSDAALTDARSVFGSDRLVVKPAVSAGADGTFLIGASDRLPAEAIGRRMLVQPFLPAIAAEGEYSLFVFGGTVSHAISKHPAPGDFRVQEQFGGVERAIAVSDDMAALATQALDATQARHNCSPLAYARVDMVRDEDGALRLMELELIEPSLFLRFAPDGGAAFARAVQTAQA